MEFFGGEDSAFMKFFRGIISSQGYIEPSSSGVHPYSSGVGTVLFGRLQG